MNLLQELMGGVTKGEKKHLDSISLVGELFQISEHENFANRN